MKFCFYFILFNCLQTPLYSQIDLNWKFKNPITNSYVDAGKSGSVQQALIENGELPDPFYGLNEEKFTWIEDHQWVFESTFNIKDLKPNSNFIEIEFPGIDTYAAVYLNDSLLFNAENNFRPYRFQIKSLLKPENHLKVIFTPPVKYHENRFKNEKFHYPATNDVGKIAIAPYTRKPQYQFGWDWAIRMNTIGFLKPVKIYSYNDNHIIGKNTTTSNFNDSSAYLDFEVFLTQPVTETIIWRSKLFGDIKMNPTKSNSLKRTDLLKQPKLWWPRGHGEQFLYKDHWVLIDASNPTNIIDEIDVTFGIRKAELIIEPDQWGTSYFVKINDRPIFCKGGDYIPQDIFPTRVKNDDIKKMVDLMVESNFNMVRVWGGGYYPDDVFYDACDEKGIMVWQDLMFACAMYPGDSSFLKNIKEEFEYQIPRIASHPSLTLFNGNNEVDVAWKNWGFQLKYGIYGDNAKQVETDYDNLFKKLAPETIQKFTNSPYVHTSPLSNWGKDEYYDHGTMHYWGVWHGKDPIEDFGKKSGRFNAEYGFQSFPEFSTLLSFSKKNEWNLESKVMKHHQKSYVGNGMILKQATILYGKPKSFEEFVYFSQLTQAKAVSIAVSAHRAGMPKCMGTLYWQLNDCWQAPTWSSVDYYGNWKALQYTVKKDYEDVAIVSKIEELGKEEYYLISDTPDTFNCKLNYTIYNFKGEQILSKRLVVNLHHESIEKVALECTTDEMRSKGYVIHFEWTNFKNELKERWFTHRSKELKKANKCDFKMELTNVDSVKKTALLSIENKNFAQDFWITSTKLGVKYSDNFIDLLPGKHQIEIHYSDSKIELNDFNFYWR